MYQALYRKYRSENFDEIAGQEPIVATLKNAICHNQITHAYLFSGPRGTGKTSIAKILAKTINCEHPNGFLPCNHCLSCIQTNQKQNTDIVEIDAASNNGVDEIRELKNKITLVPTYGKYKVYIIDEVHMLTISAFNALLKTLEEPPAHIIFILATTEPHKIPATIISRCQRFDFKRIPEEKIVKRLQYICEKENIACEEEAFYEIARLSDGGMRDAISLLDQANAYVEEKITVKDIHEVNGTVSQYDLKKFFLDYCNQDLPLILKAITEYSEAGKNLIKLTEEFILFLRNVLIYKKAPTFLQENNISMDPYKEVSEKLSEKTVLQLVQELTDNISQMKVSNNPKILLEICFIKLLGSTEEKTVQSVNEIPNSAPNIISKEVYKPIELKKEPAPKQNENVPPSTPKIKMTNQKISPNLKNIRVNNTLATFDKSLLLNLRSQVPSVKEYLLDSRYSPFVSLILDGSLRASGKNNLIFVYRTVQDTNYFNENLSVIEEILEKTLHDPYKAIAVNAEEWEEIKKQFNGKQKTYVYQEEKNEEQNTKNDATLAKMDRVQELFHDIIQYE